MSKGLLPLMAGYANSTGGTEFVYAKESGNLSHG